MPLSRRILKKPVAGREGERRQLYVGVSYKGRILGQAVERLKAYRFKKQATGVQGSLTFTQVNAYPEAKKP